MCSKRKIIDWITIVVIISVYLFLHNGPVDPHEQCIPGETIKNGVFYCGDEQDPGLNYPKEDESVSTEMLFVYSLVPWILLIIINSLLFKYYKKCNISVNNSPIPANDIILNNIDLFFRLILFTGGTTMTISEIFKLSIGRPRSNYYNTDEEAITAFPSLHTSLSICELFLLSKMFINSINFSEMVFKQRKLKMKQLVLVNNGDEKVTLKSIKNNEYDDYAVYNCHSWFLLPFWVMLRCVCVGWYYVIYLLSL